MKEGYYLPDKPCKRGHLSERNRFRQCVECNRMADRARCKERNAKILATPRLRERRKEYKRKYNSDPAKADLRRAQAKRAHARVMESPEKRKKAVERAILWAKSSPENRAKLRWRQKRWKENNQEVVSAHYHNRRARVAGNGGSFSKHDVAYLFKLQKNKCVYYFYCGNKITMKNKHIDHILPLAKGGNNDRKNLQLLCQSCNLKKWAKHPIDYHQSIGLLI